MKPVLQRSFSILLLAIAFLLPVFQRIIPLLIILLLVNWLLLIPLNKGSFNKITLPFYLSLGFFLMHIIGLTYSENLDKGVSDVVTKLSFLIFPLIFIFNRKHSETEIKNILIVFIAGCFTASIIDFGINFYNIFTEKYSINYLFGDYYSVLMHLGYFAMYLNFAIAAVVYLWLKYQHQHPKYKFVMPLLFFYFSAIVVLTTSKNGILMLLLLYFIFGLYYIFKYKKYVFGSVGVAVAIGIAIFFIEVFPNTLIRFQSFYNSFSSEEIDKQSTESTMLRRMAWTSAGEVISEHFWIGAGTGDVKAELKEAYATAGFTDAFRRGINAHNQYLQTFASIGIIGALLLIGLLLLPFYLAVVNRNYLLSLFLIINIFAALTESIFEVQAGIIFFNFFFGILYFSTQNKLSID